MVGDCVVSVIPDIDIAFGDGEKRFGITVVTDGSMNGLIPAACC